MTTKRFKDGWVYDDAEGGYEHPASGHYIMGHRNTWQLMTAEPGQVQWHDTLTEAKEYAENHPTIIRKKRVNDALTCFDNWNK